MSNHPIDPPIGTGNPLEQCGVRIPLAQLGTPPRRYSQVVFHRYWFMRFWGEVLLVIGLFFLAMICWAVDGESCSPCNVWKEV